MSQDNQEAPPALALPVQPGASNWSAIDEYLSSKDNIEEFFASGQPTNRINPIEKELKDFDMKMALSKKKDINKKAKKK